MLKLKSRAIFIEVKSEINKCRDPKDNFLLGLCDIGTADFLVTGDKDLLELLEYKGTKIISPSKLENLL